MTLPTPLYDHAAVLFGSQIVIHGGRDGSVHRRFVTIDVESGVARYYDSPFDPAASLAAFDGHLYLLEQQDRHKRLVLHRLGADTKSVQ